MIIPDVQILDQNDVWQSATAGLMSCQIQGGLAAGASKPGVGRCELVWDNTSQAYNPDPGGGAAALLRARRRLRVTATSASQGYILQVIHDGAADRAYWSQVVTAAVAVGDVWTLAWDARALFDSMDNTDQVYLVTSAESQTPVTYPYTNKWVTYTLVFTATANGTTITPRFRPHFAGTGKNSAAVEYRNITLKKGAGANVLTYGDFASGSVSPWASTDSGSPASRNTLTVIRDYRILFNGKISRIEPAPFQRAGGKTCRVIAVDFVDELQRKKITGLPLQKNQRGDQLVSTVLALPGPGQPEIDHAGQSAGYRQTSDQPGLRRVYEGHDAVRRDQRGRHRSGSMLPLGRSDPHRRPPGDRSPAAARGGGRHRRLSTRQTAEPARGAGRRVEHVQTVGERVEGVARRRLAGDQESRR